MSRQKNEQNDAIKQAAKEREAEMQPTPVVNTAFDAMQEDARKGKTSEDPVSQQERIYRDRADALEKKKDEDIKQAKKDSDGKPKA